MAELSRRCGRNELVLAAVVRPDSNLGPEDITGEEYRPVYVRELPSKTTPSPQMVRVRGQYQWFVPPFLTTKKMFKVKDGEATLFVPRRAFTRFWSCLTCTASDRRWLRTSPL